MFRPAEESQPLPIRHLGVLLLVALGLRIGLAIWLPSDRTFLEQLPDQLEYLQLADSLLAGDGLVLVDDRYPTEQAVLAQRMPGYPLLVAACGASVDVVRIIQALLDTSTVLATFLLARRWLGVWPSLLAGAFVALNPYLIYFSALILSETLFIALLAWGMVGVARPGHNGRLWWLGALALVLSVYARSSGAGLAVVVAILSVFLPGRHPFAVHSRWRVPVGMTTLLLLILVLLPWAIRNRMVLDRWVWLTTNEGITLYDGWHPDNTTGGSDQSFVARMPQLGLMNEVDRDSYLKQKAWEAARADPGRSVALAMAKAGRTWSPVPLSQQDQRLYVLAGLLFSVPLFALALLGVVSGTLPTSAKALLIAPAVYLTLIHMLSVGSLRYRLPAEPMLAILAAGGLLAIWNAFHYWRRREPDEIEEMEPPPPGEP